MLTKHTIQSGRSPQAHWISEKDKQIRQAHSKEGRLYKQSPRDYVKDALSEKGLNLSTKAIGTVGVNKYPETTGLAI